MQHELTALAAAVEQARDPLARLAAVRALKVALTAVESASVEAARAGRRSWQEVATSLGVTRQAAQRRFTARTEHEPAKAGQAPQQPSPRDKRPPGWDITTPKGRRLLRVVKAR